VNAQAVLVDGMAVGTVSALDRGLHYGDGLFETIAVTGGRALCLSRHLKRMRTGCERLRIPFPGDDVLERDVAQLLDGRDCGVVKIIATRGLGERGYRSREGARPTRVAILYPPPDYPDSLLEEGVRLRLCHTRLSVNPLLAGLKHCNRLEQILARSEWSDPAIAEGLMLDTKGHVVEGTMSNVFLVQRGQLVTPALDRCGVAGVVRQIVMERAASVTGEICREEDVLPELLDSAEELFLTNSVIGVWPVREIDGRKVETGPVMRKVAAAVGTVREHESRVQLSSP
jgi:4-amino-4-deoxychorismate lyase